MKDIYFFFDDSGVLHRNEASGYFVYAGYVFTDRHTLETAKRKYIHANKEIKKATGQTCELKAALILPRHKRALFNAVREYDSVSLAVEISRLRDYVLDSSKSICRYKDYILKRCIKSKLQQLLEAEILLSSDDIRLHINIDEQLTASNGYYNLHDSVVEELRYGIVNFNYGILHKNIFNGIVEVEIRYCESKNNYLIQASDIIANRIWSSYRLNRPDLRDIPNHLHLTFP